MGQRDLRALRAERIGLVFQNMALMPRRTVRDHVAHSLEACGRPDEERARVAARAIRAVDLTGWDQEYPNELLGACSSK